MRSGLVACLLAIARAPHTHNLITLDNYLIPICDRPMLQEPSFENSFLLEYLH